MANYYFGSDDAYKGNLESSLDKALLNLLPEYDNGVHYTMVTNN